MRPQHPWKPCASPAAAPRPPKLLDRVREACRVRHYCIRTDVKNPEAPFEWVWF
jgi:hypothetical protein